MFRLYLDEVGHDQLGNVHRDNHRYLSISATILNLTEVGNVLIPAMSEIKRLVFPEDPDENIHFHRTDIVGKKGIFGKLNEEDRREVFDAQIMNLIRDVDYTVLTVFIDKLRMTEMRYWQQRHPYNYLMEIVVEKYVQFLERQDDIGDIMPEARQGKSDIALQEAFTSVKGNGSRFVNAERMASRIRADKLKFRTKKENIAGLQLCDLIAHPSHMYVRTRLRHDVNQRGFAIGVRDILCASKYDRSPRGGVIDGYGIKTCP